MASATDARIFVDVKLQDGQDGGAFVRSILEGLGARVYKTWPGARARCTHLVWKGGDDRTLEEARACGAAVVGLSWVNACQDVGGLAASQPHALAAAPRSTARAFLVARELATTARRGRAETPH